MVTETDTLHIPPAGTRYHQDKYIISQFPRKIQEGKVPPPSVTTSDLIQFPLKTGIAGAANDSKPSLSPDTFKSRNGLGLIHLNIRSLLKNLGSVKVVVLQTDPDILVLSESWLQKSINDCDVSLAGYNLFRAD